MPLFCALGHVCGRNIYERLGAAAARAPRLDRAAPARRGSDGAAAPEPLNAATLTRQRSAEERARRELAQQEQHRHETQAREAKALIGSKREVHAE